MKNLKSKIIKTILFSVASKIIKYIGINLPKKAKDLMKVIENDHK